MRLPLECFKNIWYLYEGGHYFLAYLKLFQCIDAQMHKKRARVDSCFILLKMFVYQFIKNITTDSDYSCIKEYNL